jgi:hypothetical protein
LENTVAISPEQADFVIFRVEILCFNFLVLGTVLSPAERLLKSLFLPAFVSICPYSGNNSKADKFDFDEVRY